MTAPVSVVLQRIFDALPGNKGFRIWNAGKFQSAKTHCPHGHEYTPENVYIHCGARRCRKCKKKPTHCKRGHPYLGENLKLSKRGTKYIRQCNACLRLRKYKTFFHHDMNP